MMPMENTDGERRAALLLVNNQVVRSATKKVLESVGFETCQDVDSCDRANVGFVGSYFILFGILKHVRAVNPYLPLVLIVNPEYPLSEDLELNKDFYGVIELDTPGERETSQKIIRWFSEGQGKALLEKGAANRATSQK